MANRKATPDIRPAKPITERESSVDPTRTPDYANERAAELIGTAGAEAKARAWAISKIDWSQAPADTTGYFIRDDNNGTARAMWSHGTAFTDAPLFFQPEPGTSQHFMKSEAQQQPGNVLLQDSMGQVHAGSAIPSHEAKREGENPNSHNVSGYRKMSDSDVARINALKTAERVIASQLATHEGDDLRCAALARTHMEIAFMFAVKAIAKPADPYR